MFPHEVFRGGHLLLGLASPLVATGLSRRRDERGDAEGGRRQKASAVVLHDVSPLQQLDPRLGLLAGRYICRATTVPMNALARTKRVGGNPTAILAVPPWVLRRSGLPGKTRAGRFPKSCCPAAA